MTFLVYFRIWKAPLCVAMVCGFRTSSETFQGPRSKLSLVYILRTTEKCLTYICEKNIQKSLESTFELAFLHLFENFFFESGTMVQVLVLV